MRLGLSIATIALAAGVAHANPGTATPPPPPDGRAAPVIGGGAVPKGHWRDCAAVLFDNLQGCTGVLIAPTVVMTAGHCVDTSLNAVLIGTNSLARPSAGETIRVARQAGFPGDKYDVAILILERASTMPVRKLASGWVQSEVVDGARVEFVGYGAVDRDANQYIDELQQAESTVTDFDCSRRAGCDPGARPAGEIGAGGAGIDTCPGDSGGPMYLLTAYGEFLAGITSRGYDDNQFECSEGGIYTRPDKAEIVAWVEQEAGVYLADGRGPTGDDMAIELGASAHQRLEPNDPRPGGAYTWEIVTPPATGAAAIAADGTLTVTAADDPADTFVVVRAIDAADPARSARVRIALHYVDDGGCCSTGGRRSPGAALALSGVVALLLRRRRGRA